MHCTHDWWFFFKRLILRLLSFKIIACTLFKSNCNHGECTLFVLAHILLECNCQLLSKCSITFCKRKDREIT